MYKEDLALNNQQRLICHKPQPNQIIPNLFKTIDTLFTDHSALLFFLENRFGIK